MAEHGKGDQETVLAPSTRTTATAPADSGDFERQRVGGRYEILRLIGSGGMGTVYQARDTELDEIVALKVLRRNVGVSQEMLERFKREAKLARRVTHRNVARMFDIGDHEGERFLTMEFVDGEPLSDLVDRFGALSPAKVVQVAREICDGLGAAHAAGVVHRDLKPDNILCAKDGRTVVTDFGIARLSEEMDSSKTMGVAVGTPAYMAPEQVDASSPIDARTDIYALGAMLFELFTGETPWRGETPLGVATARLVAAPPDPRSRRPSLSSSFAAIVVRCMARAPADRYQSAAEVASALTDALAEQASPATTRSPTSVELSGIRLTGPVSVGAAPLVIPPLEKTVAVLPFRNSGRADDEYFADGLTDDLIDTLSMTKGLRVRSRGVVMKLKGVERDPRELGAELDVQVVVEGSLRRLPDAVRVSARLVSVADGFQIWARRWDRPEGDLLVVSDEVARAIADALTVEHAAPARAAPEDPRVIELYLRARQEYRKFWLENIVQSVRLYEEALALAPNDPTALSGYAIARSRLWFLLGDDDGDPGSDLAFKAADRAIALSPSSGEAHLALATARLHRRDGPGAVRSLCDAISHAPGLADAHIALARILVEAGLVEEGIQRHRIGIELDPTTPFALDDLSRAYVFLGEWNTARDLLWNGQSASGRPWLTMARLALWSSDVEWANAILEALEREDPEQHNKLSRHMLRLVATRGGPDSPHLAPLIAPSDLRVRNQRAFFHQLDAEICSFVGLLDRAFSSLEKAVERGLFDIAWLDRCPIIGPLRERPDYGAVRDTVVDRAGPIGAAFRDRKLR